MTRITRPVVLVEAPRCPSCNCIRYHADGSGPRVVSDDFGERIVRYVKCDGCGERYKIIAD